MCNINFYLKKPNIKNKCLVYLQLKTYGKKIVASTKLSIDAINWDKTTQRVRYNDEDHQNALNKFLDKIIIESEKYHALLLSQGKMSKYNLRVDLLKSGIDRIIQFTNPRNPEKESRRSKEKVDKLSDSYVRTRLVRTFGLTPEGRINIPKELVEVKRLLIKTKRELKNRQHDNKN